eukprot:g15587.t1
MRFGPDLWDLWQLEKHGNLTDVSGTSWRKDYVPGFGSFGENIWGEDLDDPREAVRVYGLTKVEQAREEIMGDGGEEVFTPFETALVTLVHHVNKHEASAPDDLRLRCEEMVSLIRSQSASSPEMEGIRGTDWGELCDFPGGGKDGGERENKKPRKPAAIATRGKLLPAAAWMYHEMMRNFKDCGEDAETTDCREVREKLAKNLPPALAKQVHALFARFCGKTFEYLKRGRLAALFIHGPPFLLDKSPSAGVSAGSSLIGFKPLFNDLWLKTRAVLKDVHLIVHGHDPVGFVPAPFAIIRKHDQPLLVIQAAVAPAVAGAGDKQEHQSQFAVAVLLPEEGVAAAAAESEGKGAGEGHGSSREEPRVQVKGTAFFSRKFFDVESSPEGFEEAGDSNSGDRATDVESDVSGNKMELNARLPWGKCEGAKQEPDDSTGFQKATVGYTGAEIPEKKPEVMFFMSKNFDVFQTSAPVSSPGSLDVFQHDWVKIDEQSSDLQRPVEMDFVVSTRRTSPQSPVGSSAGSAAPMVFRGSGQEQQELVALPRPFCYDHDNTRFAYLLPRGIVRLLPPGRGEANDPNCWAASNHLSYNDCCLEKPYGNRNCWDGLFNFQRCCNTFDDTPLPDPPDQIEKINSLKKLL